MVARRMWGGGLTDCEAGCVRALVVTNALLRVWDDNGDAGIIVEARIGGAVGLRVARDSSKGHFGHDIDMINGSQPLSVFVGFY